MQATISGVFLQKITESYTLYDCSNNYLLNDYKIIDDLYCLCVSRKYGEEYCINLLDSAPDWLLYTMGYKQYFDEIKKDVNDTILYLNRYLEKMNMPI